MDSYFNGVLSSVFWDKFAQTPEIRLAFVSFLIEKGIDTIRFNLKGDFRNENDITIIWYLAERGFNLTGYTARDDLAQTLEYLGKHENIILNGSNRCYTNRFRATDSISDYLGAKYRCLGNCSRCRKCYTLRGVEIVVLVHGNGSQTQLNNPINWALLNETVGAWYGVEFTKADSKRAKGLLTCLNKALAVRGFRELPQEFETFEDVKNFILWFWGEL
jgi:hypothetical protein